MMECLSELHARAACAAGTTGNVLCDASSVTSRIELDPQGRPFFIYPILLASQDKHVNLAVNFTLPLTY